MGIDQSGGGGEGEGEGGSERGRWSERGGGMKGSDQQDFAPLVTDAPQHKPSTHYPPFPSSFFLLPPLLPPHILLHIASHTHTHAITINNDTHPEGFLHCIVE